MSELISLEKDSKLFDLCDDALVCQIYFAPVLMLCSNSRLLPGTRLRIGMGGFSHQTST